MARGRRSALDPSITVTISGDRRAGKSMTAKLLKSWLDMLGWEVEIHEPTKIAQDITNRMRIDLTEIEPRRVIIVAT